MNAKKEILKLNDGQCWIWPKSDYGRAEIWLKNGTYFLFEIPPYGGKPNYYCCYEVCQIDKLISTVSSWA